jgi:hypothetical protein
MESHIFDSQSGVRLLFLFCFDYYIIFMPVLQTVFHFSIWFKAPFKSLMFSSKSLFNPVMPFWLRCSTQ